MLGNWLSWDERKPASYTQFAVLDVREIKPLSPEVKQHLQSLLENAKLDPGFLKAAVSYLGWKRVRALRIARQPTVRSLRRGTFGEVLFCALLEEFHRYTVPVPKLQYTITRGQSLPGTDTIALKLNEQGQIMEVCFVESKLRTTGDTGAAVQGYEQLRADYEQKFAGMLLFTANRLYDRKDPLFDEFMAYMHDRADTKDRDSFRLGLTWEKAAWTETVLQNLEDNGVDLTPLVVHVTRLSNLGRLTDELFRAIGVDEVLDDDLQF